MPARRPGWIAPAAALATAAALNPAAHAQTDGDELQRLERRMREFDEQWRIEAPPDASISERLLLDWGGSLRFGLFSIDDEESESHILRQTDGRLYLSGELDGAHRFFARLKFQYDDYNAGDDFDGEGDDLREPIGERWWYSYDHRSARGADDREPWNASLRVGKQFVEWGSGLTFSALLLAAVADVEYSGLGITLLAGDTPYNDVVDFDASRPSFDTNTKRRFLGGQIEWRGNEQVPFVHVLIQRDRNDRDATTFQDTLGQLFPTNFEYDSNYLGLGARGSLGGDFAWSGEVALETGRGLSSPISASGAPITQTREDILAWAFLSSLSWLPHDARASRYELALMVGSGDDDRLDSADTFGGNLTGTKDHAFNSLGFANTGLALAPDLSNLAVLRVGGETTPWLGGGAMQDRLRLLADGFLFTKVDPDAPINVPTLAKRFVGGELDLGVDWNILSDLTLNLRCGLFFAGSAMPAGEDGTRKLLFAGITYAF